jgi:D-amino-acid dehydrogenase
MKRVVVVGGGVIGTSCAHFLNRAGWGVTVIEKGRFDGSCSNGNCGLVCPSHVLPLAEPGAIGDAMRTLFRPDSPFRIRPRFDPSLWAWLAAFARRCTTPAMMASARAIQPLLESSLEGFRALIEDEKLECEWERRGLLFAYRDRGAFEGYAATDDLLRTEFGHPARRFDGDAVRDLEPSLRPGLAGGWYYEDDAHLRPDVLLRSWRDRLGGRGVEFREECALAGFGPDDDEEAVTEVRTSRGVIAADAVVVAAGALTPTLQEHLGCRVPIQPGKGYCLTMPRPGVCPRIPLIFPEHRVAVTPFQTGYRIGSTMEFAGYDDAIDPKRLRLLTDGAAVYLREPTSATVEERWTGWRPMTYDSLPIIDHVPGRPNVMVAAGHNMLGLTMAPATGRLVAEMIDGGEPHLDPAPYRLGRFQG